MINQSPRHWLPVILVLLASIVFVSWAVDQEAHIQGSAFLPAGFYFHVDFPGRYAAYCDMDLYPKNAYKREQNIKALALVVCEVRGAGYLEVLNVNSWHSGGLNRYIKDPTDGSTRLLVPFAEFDILWPGNYLIKACFTGKGPKYFLMSVGPTNLVATSLLISLIALSVALFLTLRQNKKKNSSVLVKNSTAKLNIAESETAKYE